MYEVNCQYFVNLKITLTIDGYRFTHFVRVSPNGFSGCRFTGWDVVEVEAFGQPHVMKLWLG